MPTPTPAPGEVAFDPEAVDGNAQTSVNMSARGLTEPEQPRRIADRFTLEEPIASGGAAVVWRAHDETLDRTVAIKLLHPHLAGDDVTVERFEREARAAAKLSHPNVVRLFDAVREGDTVALVMEHVDGPSLREIMRGAEGPLDPIVVAALGEQVASALAEAHAMDLVHRDVKPANILLTSDGVAKVTDFGIAKALARAHTTITRVGTTVGTAAYIAPEQYEGVEVDGRADIYALGIVLFECLTGQSAFQGDTPVATAAARLSYELIPPRQIRADVPRALDDIVVRATRRDAHQRFPDGRAMATALAQVVGARPTDLTAALVSGEAAIARGDDTGGIDQRPFSGPLPRTPREYLRRLLAAFIGGLVLALVLFVARDALREDPLGTAETGETVPVAAAASYDPYGEDGGGENENQVAFAFDDDPATRWTTETYDEPRQFGGGKPGTGIWFDLGSPQEVIAVDLQLARGGVAAAVYASDELPTDLQRLGGWGEQIVAQSRLPESWTFEFTPVEARYWLIWFTELSSSGDSGYRAELAEVAFLTP